MSPARYLLALVVLALSSLVNAGITSATLSGATSVNFTTADSSCAALRSAFALTAGRVLLSCAADPVVVGTELLFVNTATNPRTVAMSVVTAQSSAAPATAYPAASYPIFQTAANAYEVPRVAAVVTASAPSGAASSVVTVKDSFGTASPDQYAAMGIVFGSILAAACVIWGLKQVFKTIASSNEA